MNTPLYKDAITERNRINEETSGSVFSVGYMKNDRWREIARYVSANNAESALSRFSELSETDKRILGITDSENLSVREIER